jgi:UDP-N-acetylglucosamine 2-epimerase
LISDELAYKKMAKASNPYGDGTASLKIFNFIKENFI